ncbi:MAG: CoA transferase [Comamonadaceae bacterium]|nr:MAG: CoA transferase [Comamonadaceae bacterium]
MNSLDGIRVLDLSRVLAGPWCTQTLADLGADVIKVERPGSGDDTRSWGPPFLKDRAGGDTAEAAYYLGTNRNKRSVTCDIARPEGQALVRELAAHCQVFEVAAAPDGTKDHLILAVGNDGQYAKFCQVAGRPELASDERFVRNQDRVRNRAVLVPMLEEVMKTRTKADWLAALEAAKVPCGAINSLAEVFADPHVQQRGMVHTWEHPLAGEVRLVGSPIKLSATPVRTDSAPPLLGQQTEDVLREVLGCSDDRIAQLRSKEVI